MWPLQNSLPGFTSPERSHTQPFSIPACWAMAEYIHDLYHAVRQVPLPLLGSFVVFTVMAIALLVCQSWCSPVLHLTRLRDILPYSSLLLFPEMPWNPRRASSRRTETGASASCNRYPAGRMLFRPINAEMNRNLRIAKRQLKRLKSSSRLWSQRTMKRTGWKTC